MSNQIIKRDDAIYKEIEEFKDYEITNNVAYEMMIRNDEFKKDRLSIVEEITPILLMSSEINKKIQQSKKDDTSIDKELDDFLNNDEYDKIFKNASNTSNKWGITLNEMKNAYNLEFLFLKGNHQYFKENNKFIWDESIIDLNRNITNHYNYQSSRPSIEIKNISKVVEIKLNLSLPKEELIATISKIKDDADEGNIKAPIEVLGTELQKADNLICDTKGKCFDAREVLTKQQKLADMFFIYDCLKVGITQRKIQNEVYNYYMDKGIETITLDAKTLKKYREIAIDYIDNMRYKELVTGVKLEDL